MKFQFYLDSFLTDQPLTDRDLVTVIRKDNEAGSLLVYQEYEIEFNNNNSLESGTISGFQYLRSIWETGTCNEVELTVYDQNDSANTFLVFKGIIKISDLIFDEQQYSVKSKVSDNGFYSYINNNKELKVNLDATQTKNKQSLTLIKKYAVDLFDGSSGIRGSTIGALYKGLRVTDVFDLIVRAISDNKLTFQSAYLSSTDTEIFLFKGQALLNSYTLYPLSQIPVYEISFQELFNELNIAKNLCYFIDSTVADTPVLRIEDSEYLSSGLNTFVFSDIKELNTYFDVNRLYSQVNVGSEVTVDGISSWFTFNEATSYFGWKKESFHQLGQCNLNKELNLVNKFVISNNAIQDTIIGQGQSYIDDYFLIECNNIDTVALTADAVDYDYFGQGKHLYNLGLNNAHKLERYKSKLHTAMGNFFGAGGNGFRALLGDDDLEDIYYSTSPSAPNYIPFNGGILTSPSPFPNETTNGGYDGNGNYNNVSFQYTIPTDGDYSFTQHLYIGIAGIYRPDIYARVTSIITLYDSALAVKETNTSYVDYHNDYAYQQTQTFVLAALATDIVRAAYKIEFLGTFGGTGSQPIYQFAVIGWQSYFECNGTPEGGITISTGNQTRDILHEFEYPLSQEEFRTIKANPVGVFKFQKDLTTRYGAIQEIRQQNWNNELTKIKLNTSDATLSRK